MGCFAGNCHGNFFGMEMLMQNPFSMLKLIIPFNVFIRSRMLLKPIPSLYEMYSSIFSEECPLFVKGEVPLSQNTYL